MSVQQLEHPPPYIQERHSLDLPSVPREDAANPRNLPHLPPMEPAPASLVHNPMNHLNNGHAHSGITLQPLRLPQVPQHQPGAAPQHTYTAAAVDDPDERMAAEALLGIGKTAMPPPDHKPAHIDPRLDATRQSASAPSGYETPLQYYPLDVSQKDSAQPQGSQEPLLALLTSSHPWLGGTVNGSISAYSATKSFSPQFIKSGAEMVESTLGAVGRRTGVEDGLRRYLDSRRPNDVERLQNGSKPSVKQENEEVARPDGISRKVSGASVDSLPAYDDNKSPTYEEATSKQSRRLARPSVQRSWSAQLMITTSGLGAALNETSLRSLKFCLSLLRQANEHIRHLMDALKSLLLRYNQQKDGHLTDGERVEREGEDTVMTDAPQQASPTLADRIRELNNEIWTTFKTVVNSVSRYTGGALPENASLVVRWQLMSVPQRWQRAVSSTQLTNDDSVSSANRMLAFAIEGLDMMDQVGGVVDSTILSAERWLESMGRKKPEEQLGSYSEERDPQALPDKAPEPYRD